MDEFCLAPRRISHCELVSLRMRVKKYLWGAPALSGCQVLGIRLQLVHVTPRNSEGVKIRSLTGMASLSCSAAPFATQI